MGIDILGIIYFLIIVSFIIAGIKKGLFKSLVSLIKNILSFVVSILLAKPLALLLCDSKMGISTTNKFIEMFHEKGGIFAIKIHEGNTTEVIDYALSEMKLPSILSDLLNNLLQDYISFESVNEMTLGEAFSPIITQYMYIAISFIVIFILVRLACGLLNKLFKSLEQIPLIKFVNKTSGGILGGIIGILLVSLISFGLTFIIPLDTSFSDFLIQSMKLENQDVFTLSKFFYEENLLLTIIAFIQNLFI